MPLRRIGDPLLRYPGLFIRRYLMDVGEGYPEGIHSTYRESMKRTEGPGGGPPAMTLPFSGRPSKKYRVAKYESFRMFFHVLVGLGLIEFSGREEMAPGRIDGSDQDPRFEMGGWEDVPLDRRPIRRYYRLTSKGQRVGTDYWAHARWHHRPYTRREPPPSYFDEAVDIVEEEVPTVILPPIPLPPVLVVPVSEAEILADRFNSTQKEYESLLASILATTVTRLVEDRYEVLPEAPVNMVEELARLVNEILATYEAIRSDAAQVGDRARTAGQDEDEDLASDVYQIADRVRAHAEDVRSGYNMLIGETLPRRREGARRSLVVLANALLEAFGETVER